MENLSHCPLCGENRIKPFLTCVDHTVTHKEFTIVSCEGCGFKFTNPRPSADEIGGYYASEEYISHSNTKRGIVSQLYHIVRKRTLRQKVRLVEKKVSRGTLLDVGAGTGMFLNQAKESGWKVMGVEPDKGARDIAKGFGVNLQDSISKIDGSKDRTISAITMWHVLEHVADLHGTVQRFQQLLVANGVLIIAVPNHQSADAKHYGEFWAAYDVPRHLHHFDQSTMKRLVEQHGFTLEQTLPMVYDAYYVSMLSEKYKSGGGLVSAVLQGLKSNLSASRSGEYSSLIYVFRKV